MTAIKNLGKASKLLVILIAIQFGVILALISNRILIQIGVIPNNAFNNADFLFLVNIIIIAITALVALKDVYVIRLQRERNVMQKEMLSNIEKLNQKLRSQRHDFLNHIQVVYSLIEMKEYDECEKYLNKVYGDIESVNSFIKTNDAAINALLQAKVNNARNKGIDLIINIFSNLDGFYVESWQMCRCLGNILDNAIFAASKPEESGNAEGSVFISISETITDYEFKITNTGPPIDDKIKSKLFEPGFTTKDKEGEGMGLYIVSEIVKSYNGQIFIESEKVKTSFTLLFPKPAVLSV